MTTATVAAVDLGASSGRTMVARVGPGRLDLTETNRFRNEPVRVRGTLHWDILALYRGVLDGLREAGPVDSIGIDTWAIDYGLLDSSGALLGNPVHYRDARTDGVMDKVLADIPAADLYATTGLQQLPFTTVYQLVAAAGSPQLAAARRLLLIPDLLAYWLTGEQRAEITNASTTQLLDVRHRTWSTDLIERVGLDPALLAPLCEPGETIGTHDGTPVVAVGSHDTASAVVGVPAEGDRFAYISSGTWSLVGVELDRPVLSEDSRRANFTNELGVDGTVRYLRNVMGLWLLQECLRTWGNPDLESLLREAAAVPAFASIVDPDDPVFLPPGDMPARIADACRRLDQPAPESPARTVRCIVDSLAVAYRRTVAEAQRLSGHAVDVVHVVGGGARNALLCQLTADACGLPVVAGPVEATALGNVLIQARARGAAGGTLTDLRRLLRDTQRLHRYEPRPDEKAWRAADARLGRPPLNLT
jgi:rhamnulokinase